MTLSPVVTEVAAGSRANLGKALTGSAGLLSGQEVMNGEAREYTSSRVRGASKA